MDEFERGLITGAVLVAMVFGIVLLHLWLDEREQARENERWFEKHREHRD